MIVELISVGTELLLGNIVNTNAQYLAKQLATLGLDCYYQTTVGDNPDRLKSALEIAYSRSDMVILTGGLGPTKDDLTKEMLMNFFNRKSTLDLKAYEMLSARLERGGFSTISESQKKQAMVPENAIILYNNNGTAPGCIIEEGGKICIMLPGPPKEMKPMFEEYCVDYLRKHSDCTFVSINIKMMSRENAPLNVVGEAPVAERLGDEILDNPNPTVATYAKEDGCLVRVTASAPDREGAIQLLIPMVKKCRQLLIEEYIQYVEEDV